VKHPVRARSGDRRDSDRRVVQRHRFPLHHGEVMSGAELPGCTLNPLLFVSMYESET
jgi:hypothetical protein